MPDTTSKLEPIKGGFRVLVVPADAVIQHPGKSTNLTIMNDPAPNMIPADHTGRLRVLAHVGSRGVSASQWAFDDRSKKQVADDLRKLAAFIETGVVLSSGMPHARLS